MNTLDFLYKTRVGRVLLAPLVSYPVSAFSGFLMNRRFSKRLVKSFAEKNGIDVDDYLVDDVKTFNQFFYRRIKPGKREVVTDANTLITPCDGLLKVYKADGDSIYPVKQSEFSLHSLLRDKKLAESLEGGYVFVYRLCVDNYHRYIYFDSGVKSADRHIKGIYHTVRPVALEGRPVFVENTRDYTVIDSPVFGRCVQMEVGAMLVGKIVNERTKKAEVVRGEEKGHFEYGGSTIIVIVPKDKVELDRRFVLDGEEVPVKMGEAVGHALSLK